jgi:uncharacterized protein YrrD
MNYSDLKGRPVVDISTARTIGHLEDLVLRLENRQITGFKVKESGLFGKTNILPIVALKSVGEDALTVQPAEDVADTAFENDITLSSLLNKQVVSHGGKLLGQISDISLDPANLTITGYEVKEGGLLGKKRSMPETPDLTFGPEMVVIPDALAAQLGSA